jgi:probable F420-dependent oxidoreductase
MRSEYEEASIPFDEPAARVGRLTEAVVIIRRLLAGERVTYAGRHYVLAGLEGRPVPTQRPHPPILIGGGGKRTLTLAGREASIVGFVPRARRDGSGLELDDLAAAALTRQIAWVQEAAGDRFGSLELNALIQVARVTDDPAAAADPLTARFRASRETVLASPYVLLGSIGQICETLHERRERHGISYLSIFEDDADALAPVVARLTGT